MLFVNTISQMCYKCYFSTRNISFFHRILELAPSKATRVNHFNSYKFGTSLKILVSNSMVNISGFEPGCRLHDEGFAEVSRIHGGSIKHALKMRPTP